MSAIIEFHLVKAAAFMALARDYAMRGNEHNAAKAELKALQNYHTAMRYGIRTDEETAPAHTQNQQLSLGL